MPLIRVGGGVVIGLVLAILTLQNLSPVLSLTFLGARSQPLALGILLLGAVGAGVVTGLVLIPLTTGSGGSDRPRRRPPNPQPFQGFKPPAFFRRERPTKKVSTDSASDWFAEPVGTSDWGNNQPWSSPPVSDASGSSRDRSPDQAAPPRSTPPPRRQAVVDAEYRELSPPYERPEDDLDFELDDDFFRDWPEET
ncbi:hypothetical protein GS597_07160 [Synechococcales cyanobacterium C]|uniref:Lipopolysaccharide assembly protein A domain-containing protein n=1 Tax=Petrachloros mirabilis ULC683 TaxID=2781853 RepID=A0A8K1ZYJ2_9CYAN|nr:hypothetical protein [Petrachloros mirabilis]NCJ06293.1 hypothetical protein [Petrachloros mirabilis ULC683]